jgi:hypothetical protein
MLVSTFLSRPTNHDKSGRIGLVAAISGNDATRAT